jgi:hypothetical protein
MLAAFDQVYRRLKATPSITGIDLYMCAVVYKAFYQGWSNLIRRQQLRCECILVFAELDRATADVPPNLITVLLTWQKMSSLALTVLYERQVAASSSYPSVLQRSIASSLSSPATQ